MVDSNLWDEATLSALESDSVRRIRAMHDRFISTGRAAELPYDKVSALAFTLLHEVTIQITQTYTLFVHPSDCPCLATAQQATRQRHGHRCPEEQHITSRRPAG